MQLRGPMWLSFSALWSLKLPSQCLVCQAWPSHEVVCADCLQCVGHDDHRCTGCALVLPGLGPAQPRCGACLRKPPLWHRAGAWTDYCAPWSHLITRWKFGQQPALARHFARWMGRDVAVRTLLAEADVLIPIPLSPQRMRERGYNPAAQLARHLAPTQCLLQGLRRVRHTPAQSDLTRAQRLRNLRAAFEVPPAQLSHVQGRKVLLVDDVMTTGATFTAASRCLLAAGAAQVQVLCMARTP